MGVLLICSIFQPSLPARGATKCPRTGLRPVQISTLAPREGSDLSMLLDTESGDDFNPRSPRGERRDLGRLLPVEVQISTLAPREGSDRHRRRQAGGVQYFNPRSPRGERPYTGPWMSSSPEYFNPRSPRGERPNASAVRMRVKGISTLAPREGSDSATPPFSGTPSNFNPRSPRGERPTAWRWSVPPGGFQPSLPARGATLIIWHPSLPPQISTLAPREGSDWDDRAVRMP